MVRLGGCWAVSFALWATRATALLCCPSFNQRRYLAAFIISHSRPSLLDFPSFDFLFLASHGAGCS